MVRVNSTNRDQFIEKCVDNLINNMTTNALRSFAGEKLYDELKCYNNTELHDFISRIYPELLED